MRSSLSSTRLASKRPYGLTAFARCPRFPRHLRGQRHAQGGLTNAEGLEDIRCPVLIVFGSRDRITPPHEARYFLDRIADARLVERPGWVMCR
jgi:pimeloyl-ACP methyl ester carboxylesterase